MKEYFKIMLLCTAVVLGACTKELPEIDEEYNLTAPVGFVVVNASGDAAGDDAGALTRGTPITDPSQMTTMGVFASYSGNNDWTASASLGFDGKMLNKKFTYSAGEWEYSTDEEVYWEDSPTKLNDRYSFFAYAPYASGVYDSSSNPTGNGIVVNTAVTTGIPTLTYTVPNKVQNQPDLMITTKKNVRPTGAKVPLAMEHALTSVAFQIAGNGEEVKAIAIQGVSVTGTLNIDEGVITWGNLGATTTTDFSASLNYDTTGDGAGVYYTTTSTMSTDLIAGDGYLMMIPQTLTSDAKVVVTYIDGSTRELALFTHTWEAGGKVIYNIILKSEGGDSLEPGDADILYFDRNDNNRLAVGKWGVDVTNINDLVYTQFGSIIGLTVSGGSGSIQFDPTETHPQDYDDIPNYLWHSYFYGAELSVSDPGYHSDINLSLGIGDICKLAGLTSDEARTKIHSGATLDSYESGWRLPTLQENRMFIGIEPDDQTNFASPAAAAYYTWTANDGNASNPATASFFQNKYYQAGVNNVTLPAAGYFSLDNGSLANLGSVGGYWSSTPTPHDGSSGYSFMFSDAYLRPSYVQPYSETSQPYTVSLPIRCISTAEPPSATLSVSPEEVMVLFSPSTGNSATVTTDVADGWTAEEYSSWITLDKASGASGEAVTFSVTQENPSMHTTREAQIIVRAGDATPVTITVTQEVEGMIAPPGVIGYIRGTNTLTLRGSKEYAYATVDLNGNGKNDVVEYAETIDPRGLENQTVYAAYFKFGSLIAISSDPTDFYAPHLEPEDIITGPTGYTGWSALKTNPKMANIPFYDSSADYNYQNGSGVYTKRDISHPDYQDPSAGKGDPCVYYFGNGWRSPTGKPYNGYAWDDPSKYLEWTNKGDLGTGLPAGLLSTKPGEIGVFYIAMGVRGGSGQVQDIRSTYANNYWSSTATGGISLKTPGLASSEVAEGFYLHFNMYNYTDTQNDWPGPGQGYAIRCVQP